MPTEYRKVVVIGDASCGKTSLISVMSGGELLKNYIPTFLETTAFELVSQEKSEILEFWDTSGQDEYKRLRSLAYVNADLTLACFSVDSAASLKNVKKLWAPEHRRNCDKVPIFLVGCKKDLRNEMKKKQVSYRKGLKAMKKIQAIGYFECSSANALEAGALFDMLVRISFSELEPNPTKCWLSGTGLSLIRK